MRPHPGLSLVGPVATPPRGGVDGAAPLEGRALTGAISAAVVALYGEFSGHDRTTATTYLNDNIVVCVLQNILTTSESRLVRFGGSQEVIDGRIAFQADTQDEFTAAVEDLTGRRVVAFLSANQTTPGCACELFFLARDGSSPGPNGQRSSSTPSPEVADDPIGECGGVA